LFRRASSEHLKDPFWIEDMKYFLIVIVFFLSACGEDDRPAQPEPDMGADLIHEDASDMDNDTEVPLDMTTATPRLDALLSALNADLDGALFTQSNQEGWPAPVEGGLLFVSTSLNRVAGDFDAWAGTEMNAARGYRWLVVNVSEGRYKFTNGEDWSADPWSRAYDWDENGQISLISPTYPHRARFFQLASHNLLPRTVRVWVPEGSPTHILYMHDGQNLMDADSFMGGWKVHESVPAAMMIVGIDNTNDRFDEYTHVTDRVNGDVVGGRGDDYADFLQQTIRPMIRTHFGEPAKVGVMGSSLGGLISFHIADRYPEEFDFAASLSGTMGWGKRVLNNETMIERYQAAGLRSVPLYLDSGGGSSNCVDTDGDGVEDDGENADNYCENKQLERVLMELGYVPGESLWHWHEPGALHNEIAWSERIFRPLNIFADLQ